VERPHFYVQIPDSDERGVVQVFRDALEDFDYFSPGSDRSSRPVNSFIDIAHQIDSMNRPGIIVTLDEFQYFHRAALTPFASLLQARVDQLRDQERGGLFVLGSIHTEMMAILEDRSAPLFNRVTHRLAIDHWDFATLFEMFDTFEIPDAQQQLFLWSLFEGVPKFYRDCFEQGVLQSTPEYRRDTLRALFFDSSSPLRDEASNWFLREMRGRVDTVLRIVAKHGPCPLGEIKAEYGDAEDSSGKQLGVYLQALIERYRMIEKLVPILSDAKKGRKARYAITDNFLMAWLKAVERNVNVSRVQPVEVAVDRAAAFMETAEGVAFEKMIRFLCEECSRKGRGDFPLTEIVRGYWNKPDGSDIEIDIVALNRDDRRVRFGSCKRSEVKHTDASLKGFRGHVDRFLATKEGRSLADWDREYALYAPRFNDDRRRALLNHDYRCYDLPDFARVLT
jgi:AAA+ ATPase superfamily predicted ATPase